jgi:hypothetical protein
MLAIPLQTIQDRIELGMPDHGQLWRSKVIAGWIGRGGLAGGKKEEDACKGQKAQAHEKAIICYAG